MLLSLVAAVVLVVWVDLDLAVAVVPAVISLEQPQLRAQLQYL
jgi:hypothetical protein